MSYLNCYGKWEKFSQNSSVGFELENREDLYHKGKDRFNEYTPKINGNVIKLHLSCQVDVQNCVLLKVNGTQNCKVDSTTTSSPPTTSATTAQLPQTTTSTTTSTSFSDTSTNQQTTAISITKAERLSTTSSTESTPEHPMPTRHFSETKTTDAITSSPQKEKSASNGGSSGGAIEGAIGGVVALVVIVVILIVILKRRRKRCAKEKRESVAPIADNPSYHNASPANGQLEFPDDDEYSYACTNNHPIVIKEQNGKAVTGSNVANDNNRNINGVLGSPPNQQAPVYSTLEDPNYAKLQKSANTSNGPSYNVLARPENKWTAKQGPVYDVLEDPNTLPNKNGPIYNTLKNPNEPSYNTLERPENKWMTKQGPVYDILEDPNSTGGPVYSVLEGPNSNDQQAYDALEGQDTNVYGSLDSPDPHVYGALYSPTSKSASAYDNDIYDSAGGTIIDEDTYQELNQTDQRSSDIYQPVRPPRNTMAMKNMSGITQSQA
ncbi:uncharacterized protein LOC110237079 [Exaiptasia diaphana]|uniref:Uncharacterized protein n=1 Tax=Exaiptasia diaphana TaxID=2652724 RepID=A0A913X3K0_EXADI|nr:uncharacterized protein LOC110237079 [Exaiptasia diaphana]